jgi:hypothetical protein
MIEEEKIIFVMLPSPCYRDILQQWIIIQPINKFPSVIELKVSSASPQNPPILPYPMATQSCWPQHHNLLPKLNITFQNIYDG